VILTKEERKNLLAVKTTKKEARSMKRRFETLLKKLRKEEKLNGAEFLVKISCPHCETAHRKENPRNYCYNCKECAYTKAALEQGMMSAEDGDDFSCVKFFSFGNVSYEMIDHLISLDRTGLTIDRCPVFMDEIERQDLEKFAKGHIEWANLVLKRKTKK